MTWFINSLGLVLGIGLAIFILGALVGALIYYANEKYDEEMDKSYKVYQNSNSSKNINIGVNCSVVQTDEATVIKNDKYTVVVTKDGISVNGKKIDLNKEDAE